MANLGDTGLAKYSNEMTKSGILTAGDFQENYKNFKKVDKRDEKGGILKNGDYNRNGKFGNNTFKVCQKLNEMTNEAC